MIRSITLTIANPDPPDSSLVGFYYLRIAIKADESEDKISQFGRIMSPDVSSDPEKLAGFISAEIRKAILAVTGHPKADWAQS